MKILHVGKYYPPFRGGMETVLENLATGLLEAGHEVSVLVAGGSFLERQEIIQSAGSSARLTRLANLGVVNSQPLTPGLPRALRLEIQRHSPDLVHLHLPNPLLAASWLWASLVHPGLSTPAMAVWHHADITRQKMGRSLVSPLVNRCLQLADGICVSSAGLVDHSRDLAAHLEKVRVIPFGITPEPWADVQPIHDGPFLFIGRLVPYKGLEVLVEAMAGVREGRLVLVGEGPLRASLVEQIKTLGLADRVRVAGALPRKEILAIMSHARALVLPSLDASETFGLVQLEAMAAGLPVVATDLPTGIREVGQPEETCLLVPPGDSNALSSVLARLQGDVDLCQDMGARGRERFQVMFTRGRMINELVDWYGELLSRPVPPER
jgi:glycosyltransferase involved in cell wall biosynthesis